MADTRRELILARVKTNLDTITTATVYRSRVEPLSRGEAPAIIVEPVSDQPNDGIVYTQLQWLLRFRVMVVVRDNSLDDKADEFTQLVHSKIMNDPTMNGTALDTQADRVEFELYEADVPLTVVSMDYLVKYRSDRVDLTST
jgi:hypothetical protein|tara:strand:+ start:168 stop:593 length:426 start_codon:yes stop_codon:yes gene_type:complete